MTFRYSLVHDLKPHRFYPDRPSGKPVAGWDRTLRHMRQMWEAGENTLIETRFYCELNGNRDPIHRRLPS